MKWFIGQSVVCIHATDRLVEGNVYEISGLRVSKCTCHGTNIDVGEKSRTHYRECETCAKEWREIDGIAWYGEDQFRPLDELVNIDELTEVLTEPAFKV